MGPYLTENSDTCRTEQGRAEPVRSGAPHPGSHCWVQSLKLSVSQGGLCLQVNSPLFRPSCFGKPHTCTGMQCTCAHTRARAHIEIHVYASAHTRTVEHIQMCKCTQVHGAHIHKCVHTCVLSHTHTHKSLSHTLWHTRTRLRSRALGLTYTETRVRAHE